MPKPPPPPNRPWPYEVQRCWPVEDVPPPSDGRVTYPWEIMEPTDHFLVRCPPAEVDMWSARLSSAGSAWFQRHRPEWAVRVCKVRKGVRVWVIELPQTASQPEEAAES